MSVLTQGTEIFFINPVGTAGPSVQQINCATTFSPGGNPADQIPDTCLEDTTASFKPGLRQPGQATMEINADPANVSHVLLHELSELDPSPVLQFAVGWSDGSSIPELGTDGGFSLPPDRTWFVFQGYIADFPFDFAGNNVVKTAISIQRSGGSSWIPKTA